MASAVDNTLDKQRRADRAKLYKALTEKPAEEARAAAVAQIAAFESALGSARDALGARLGRWKFFDEALVEARTFLAEGDKLQAAQDEPSRVQRRRFYARAYVNLLSATDQLDPELQQGRTWVVLLDDAATATKKTAEDVLEKAEDLIDDIGAGLSSTVTILAVGIGLGVIAYGVSKGRR